jgi:hypothetical protein
MTPATIVVGAAWALAGVVVLRWAFRSTVDHLLNADDQSPYWRWCVGVGWCALIACGFSMPVMGLLVALGY